MIQKQVGSDKKYLIKNVSSVTICRLLGVLTGIIVDAMILKTYGVGTETDALFAAIAIPVVITRIFEVQGPNVLVPVFASDAGKYDRETFKYCAGNIIIVIAVILLAFTLIGTMFSEVLMKIQVPGFSESKRHIAIVLNKLLFWLIFIQGVETIIKCLLMAHHSFVIAASGKIIINLFILTSILLLQSKLSIYAVGIGYVLGSVFSLLVVSLTALIKGIRIKAVFNIRDSRLHHSLKLFALPLSGHVFGESKDLIENYIVSFLPSGDLSILRYGSRIVTAVSGVLLGGIVTTTLPLISEYASQKNIEKMKESFIRAIKVVTLISMPVCIWLIFTSKDLLVLLFVRGQFTIKDAAAAGVIIAAMTPYVLFSRLISITQTPFFATMDMKTPLYSMIVSFVSYIIIAISAFKFAGIYSFPIAHSLSTMITTAFITKAFVNRFGSFFSNTLFKYTVKIIIVTSLTAVAFFVCSIVVKLMDYNTFVLNLISFFLPSIAGTFAFMVFIIIFKIGDFRIIINSFKKGNGLKINGKQNKLAISKESAR